MQSHTAAAAATGPLMQHRAVGVYHQGAVNELPAGRGNQPEQNITLPPSQQPSLTHHSSRTHFINIQAQPGANTAAQRASLRVKQCMHPQRQRCGRVLTCSPDKRATTPPTERVIQVRSSNMNHS